MSLICSLSGQEAEEAVVSRSTGNVFEKRLIEKYLASNDRRCPVTGQTLDADDLLPLKVNRTVRPRPATGTSVPSMLQLFQSEWDAAMLECYSLKQQLNLARQQLAHALYQQDAACRVIARLTRERDEARSALSTVQAQPSTTTTATAGEGMDVEGGSGIPDQVKQRLLSVSKQLTAERKKRTVPKETATEEQIKSLRVTSSHPTHSSSKPGILCLDLHPTQDLAVTGGADTNVVVLNRQTGVAAPPLTGHSKRVTSVAFHPERDALVSASQDGTVRLWSAPQGQESNAGIPRYAASAEFQPHGGAEVTSLSLHPTGDFVASASLNGSWAFTDLSARRTLACVPSVGEANAVHAASFHPDGLIYATGTSAGKICVWDLKTLGNVAKFEDHTAPICSVAFSENGFYMASAAADHTVRLWDLRKLKSFQTLELSEESVLSSVVFDYSGKYLAVGGSDGIGLYGFAGKLVEPLVTLTDHSAPVTAVRFGKHAHLLASTSLDRTLKFFHTSS